MDSIWTIAEQYNGCIKQVSYELLSRGRALADTLGSKLVSVLIGYGVEEKALNELIERGADEVYVVSDRAVSSFVCETYSNILASLAAAHNPNTILAAATTTGRTLMPHLAVKLRTGLTADCTELSVEQSTGDLLQIRPAIGGNIMATIKTPHTRPQMATVRPKSILPRNRDVQRTGTIIRIPFEHEIFDQRVSVLGNRHDPEEMDHIEQADAVVSGGRGMRKAEYFTLLRELAGVLDGAIGASRDAVDRGWATYPHQVGLSGKTISPRLYIAAGISGSVQHLAGIKTAESIVAINNDPNAPIHQIADFSIVGDLFALIPLITKKLRQRVREVKR